MSLCKNVSQKCVRLAVFLFLVGAFGVAAQAQVVFSPPKNISNSSGNTQSQQIAVDANGNVNIIWLDDSSGTLAVLFSRSSDGGVTFSAPQNISNQTGSSANSPQFAVDSGGNIFVIWTSFSSGNSTSVLFTRSTDSGATFSAPRLISNTGANGFAGQLGVDSRGNIDVVWSEVNSIGSSVLFSRSVDGGASFSTAQNLSANSFEPQIAVDLAPLLNDGSSLFHSGRTIPVKFQLTATEGSMVTNAVANVQVFQIQNTPTGTVDQDMSVTASGSSSSGTAFRFDPTSNQYIYNLNTSGYASGTYLLRTTISDGSTHDVQFSIQ